MKILHETDGAYHSPTVLTIGTFDGVHIGHQKIVKRLVAEANRMGLKSVVLTFFPHPRMVLQKDANIKLINTLEERAAIMEGLGLDCLYVKKFTKEFSRLTAEEFVGNVLVNELKVKKIIIGYDHHFGRNRTANIDDLREFGEEYGFEVEEISAQDVNEVAVSSTKIRAALAEGDVSKAKSYLGHPFSITGEVVKGKGLGRTLEFPTANIALKEEYKLVPKNGVYIVKSIIDDKVVYGMMNIGVNPTVNGANQTIEVNYLNLNKDLYSSTVTVELLERIRDEEKFDSVEALQNQLRIDRETTLAYISEHLNE
ncbi:bifunctional riboflavin kinase/FAD synthetase [Mangrovimonas aestuarii]|uniref:bifunctional riboflavin kinase/FAD synthetase n=1 Tax=Mangrovimonas aestuarii TaxID=3018443 RepID=UPI002379F14B|nr:bifunctional riboflavin kinase/FAD synthetase [Mangrovimonas aestuarii]